LLLKPPLLGLNDGHGDLKGVDVGVGAIWELVDDGLVLPKVAQDLVVGTCRVQDVLEATELPLQEQGSKVSSKRAHSQREHNQREHNQRTHSQREHSQREHSQREHSQREHSVREHSLGRCVQYIGHMPG
jgi:hypothetical protein